MYSLWILNVQIWVSTTTLRIQDNSITPKTPAFHPFQSHTPPPTPSELDNHQPVLHCHKFTFLRGSYKRNCPVCNLWDRLFHSAHACEIHPGWHPLPCSKVFNCLYCHNLFIHLLTEGHLGCFQVWPIMTRAARSFVCFCEYVFTPLEKHTKKWDCWVIC